MQIFDKVVDVLTKEAGLMVILNNNVSEAQRCCHLEDGSGLWHSRTYSQQKFFVALENMTRRYAHNPMVVGNDLRNEPKV